MSATIEATPATATTTSEPTKRRGRPRKAATAVATAQTNKRRLTAKGNNKATTKTAAEMLSDKEAALRKEYPLIIEGSIKRHNSGKYNGKITVQIRCKTKDCPNIRTVATSDLFQVQYCEECTEKRRQANRSKAAKKAK